MSLLAWIVLGIVVLILFWTALHHYNRGVSLQNRCDESWSNVDTELLRRHDLIPNLVAAVKGYAKHEKEVMLAVAKARTMAKKHAPADHQGNAENRLDRALGRMLAVAEDNPRLKASENFLKLQDELAITEDRIQAARRFYNANVRDYHNHTEQFPGNIFARLYGFGHIPFFKAKPGTRELPRVGV